jgi:hypothetical protein
MVAEPAAILDRKEFDFQGLIELLKEYGGSEEVKFFAQDVPGLLKARITEVRAKINSILRV